MTQKTILNETHRALGAKMVDFGGWDMPIHYGSQIDEHHQVRRDAGMFDVSHMTVVDLRGAQRPRFLRQLVANSVDKLKKPGKALYTCMLDEQRRRHRRPDRLFHGRGFLPPGGQRRHPRQGPGLDRRSRPRPSAWASRERRDLAMIAVQGPNARAKVLGLLSPRPPSARRQARQVRRRARPTASVRRAHRLHRRGRLRDHGAGSTGGRLLEPPARGRREARPASARATPCAWKPA